MTCWSTHYGVEDDPGAHRDGCALETLAMIRSPARARRALALFAAWSSMVISDGHPNDRSRHGPGN